MPRASEKGLGRAESVSFRLRLPLDLKSEWDSYVAQHGDEAADAIRKIMWHLVQKPAPARNASQPADHETPGYVAAPLVDQGKKKALKLLLTPSEHAALTTLAEERECSVQFWIISLIRAALTDGHTVGGAELKRLGESNYQLMAIGRNLNQITHQINADSRAHLHRVTEKAIGKLSVAIESHRRDVHAVIDSCTHRWLLTKDKNER